MNGGHHERGQRRSHKIAALSGDAEVLSKESLCRGGSKAYQHFWFQSGNLTIKPRAACVDLRIGRLFMDAPFTASVRDPLKMLHNIRDINLRAFDARLRKSLVQQFPGWANKWASIYILVISRLLTN